MGTVSLAWVVPSFVTVMLATLLLARWITLDHHLPVRRDWIRAQLKTVHRHLRRQLFAEAGIGMAICLVGIVVVTVVTNSIFGTFDGFPKPRSSSEMIGWLGHCWTNSPVSLLYAVATTLGLWWVFTFLTIWILGRFSWLTASRRLASTAGDGLSEWPLCKQLAYCTNAALLQGARIPAAQTLATFWATQLECIFRPTGSESIAEMSAYRLMLNDLEARSRHLGALFVQPRVEDAFGGGWMVVLTGWACVLVSLAICVVCASGLGASA